MKPWKTVASKVTLRDTWITLRADVCMTSSGILLDPYYVLEYPDWVNITAMDDQERLLLVRQYRQGSGRIEYEIPGGVIDPHDATPQDAARRELLEETGFHADEIVPVGRLSPNLATHANTLHCFAARGLHHDPASLNPDETEDIAWEFASLTRVSEMIADGRYRGALQVSGIFLSLKYWGLHLC